MTWYQIGQGSVPGREENYLSETSRKATETTRFVFVLKRDLRENPTMLCARNDGRVLSEAMSFCLSVSLATGELRSDITNTFTAGRP